MKFATFLISVSLLCSAAVAAPERVVLPKSVVPSHYDLAIEPNAAAKTFSGTATITLTVVTPTQDIVLNAADLAFQKVALSGRKEAPKVSFDSKTETASLHFAKPIAPGSYTLTIAYNGKIFDSPAGLFALDYDGEGGKKRALYTQFENSDARRFLPSWDEPGIKTTFTLTATLPASEMPLSNMPVASEAKLAGGLKRVTFQTSPKMSSYLLFYGQGDFERIARKVGDVEIGVVVKRGDTSRAAFALDATAEILPYYNDYFGTPYPLPKLDLIAGPGQSQFFGAMENWGAMFFFERTILVDAKTADESDKRGRYITIAHETAHQWFGDLVTMAWWDDLWLNEGFASWMEYKAADRLHPDWNIWLSAARSKEYALSSDARLGTHPIVQPIADVLQASQAFDEITYMKGAAVIHMVEDYLGEDAFRAGVRAYMKKYAYGNTVTDDLWTELEKASGQPVTAIAHDFTLQAGVPLLCVTKTAKGLVLTQSRFAVDDSGREARSWHIPVTITDVAGKPIWRGVVFDKPVEVAVPKDVVAVVNARQAGYYRTLYDPALFASVADRFAALSPYDQLGLVGDTAALGNAGFVSPADVLQLAAKTTPQMDSNVQQAAAGRIEALLGLTKDLPGEARARAFGDAVLAPLFAKIGWDAKAGEDGNIAILRNRLIETLGGAIANPAVVAEARKRFAAFLVTPDSLPGALRSSVLDVVAYHADAADWEKLHGLAVSTTNSMEKAEYYALLGATRDKTLAQKALDLSLTAEVPVTQRPAIISQVASEHPELAFDFARAHMDVLDALLETSSRNQFYIRLAMPSHDPETLKAVDAFAATHIPENARGIVVKAKAMIAQVIKLRSEAAPKVDAWLMKNGPRS
jgi:aminopeptidase N